MLSWVSRFFFNVHGTLPGLPTEVGPIMSLVQMRVRSRDEVVTTARKQTV